MGWVPLVMVISISNTEELLNYYSTNRTTMVATIVLNIVPIEVGQQSNPRLSTSQADGDQCNKAVYGHPKQHNIIKSSH